MLFRDATLQASQFPVPRRLNPAVSFPPTSSSSCLLQWPGRGQAAERPQGVQVRVPTREKKPKLHRRDGLQCVRCHDARQVVLSDHGGLSPEAEHAMECASGHEPARGIFFSLNHSRIRTRTRGVQDNQDQDLGPWGLMVMPVTVIRRYSYTGEYVYTTHSLFLEHAHARGTESNTYSSYVHYIDGRRPSLKLQIQYTEVRVSLTMFSRRWSRRGETKVLIGLNI